MTAIKIGPRPERWLRKKARQGMRGFPVGTVAFYGPDDRRASKVAVSFIRQEGAEPELRRWFSEAGDVRTDETIFDEIAVLALGALGGDGGWNHGRSAGRVHRLSGGRGLPSMPLLERTRPLWLTPLAPNAADIAI